MEVGMDSARDRRAKFVELAEARVSKAIKTIRLIGNLTNKNNYEYDEADFTKIVTALEAEIRELKTKLKTDGGKAKPEFKL
jgi:hypothetical protein